MDIMIFQTDKRELYTYNRGKRGCIGLKWNACGCVIRSGGEANDENKPTIQ